MAHRLPMIARIGLFAAIAASSSLALAPSAGALGDPGPLRPICFPAQGQVSWTDTYGEPRDGHVHQGQDLMGVKLQPLLAAHDATVSALKWDTTGNYIFLTDSDGWQYWYIHVNNDTPGTDDGANPFEWAFAPGMAVGVKVQAGQFIAYMGDSGNAESVAPHLHFELHIPDGSYSGLPVNPYTSLVNAADCGIVMPPETFMPFTDAGSFATQQYSDFLDRAPDAGGLDYWTNSLGHGLVTPAQMIGQMMASPEFGQTVSPVVRLYFAYFDRFPDADGLTYWLDQYRAGMSLGDISDAFITTREFKDLYGDLRGADFVNLVYTHVLGRAPDSEGLAYWVDRLDNGLTRGDLMVSFSESSEYQQTTAAEVYVTMAYFGMLRRAPDQAGFDFWLTQPIGSLVDGIRLSSEYADRF